MLFYGFSINYRSFLLKINQRRNTKIALQKSPNLKFQSIDLVTKSNLVISEYVAYPNEWNFFSI